MFIATSLSHKEERPELCGKITCAKTQRRRKEKVTQKTLLRSIPYKVCLRYNVTQDTDFFKGKTAFLTFRLHHEV